MKNTLYDKCRTTKYFPWTALLILTGLAGGCSTNMIPYNGPAPFETAPPAKQEKITGPMSLNQAVQRAIMHNSPLAILQGEMEVALETAKIAGDIRDPEIQAGYGNEDFRGVRSGRETETGTGSEWGEGTDIQHQTESGNRSGVSTETGIETETFTDPLEPDHHAASTGKSTSQSTYQSTSQSGSKDRFARTSSSKTSVISGGNETSDSDTMNIGLRVFPPNPWTYTAQRSLAAAEAYMAQAELRHAQVELSFEVATLFSEILYLEEDIKILEQMVMLNKTAHQTSRDLNNQGLVLLEDDMLIWRRYQASMADLSKTQRNLAEKRRIMAGLVAISLESLQINTNKLTFFKWKEPAQNKQILCEYALDNRSDIMACRWRIAAAESALKEAKSYRIPWFSHIEASYSRQLQDGFSTRWSDSKSETSSKTQSKGDLTGENSGTSSGTQTGSRTETSTENSTVTEVDYSSSESSSESSETGTRTRTDSGSESRFGTTTESGWQHISDEGRSDEWFVGFGINIPIFSWTKSGVKARVAEHMRALDIFDKVCRESAGQVCDWIVSIQKTELIRSQHIEEAGKAKVYLEQTIKNMENLNAIEESKLLAMKMDLLQLQRTELELDHECRIASIGLESALGQIVGAEQDLLLSFGNPDTYSAPGLIITEQPVIRVTQTDTQALFRAVRAGNSALFKTILENSGTNAVHCTLKDGLTLLHLAAAMNYTNIASLLISKGANMNATTLNGFTPLHWAASKDAADVANLLISKGANIHALAGKKITPLYWAIRQHSAKVMNALIAAGANITTNSASTASSFANNKNPDITPVQNENPETESKKRQPITDIIADFQ